MYLRKSLFTLIITSFLSLFFSYGQELNKIVFVESAFKPMVEHAQKIGVLPIMSDTLIALPEINYSVLPSRVETKYKIKPIKPAKLVGSPLDKLYNSQLRLGIGNYTTPIAEFNINSLRSKEYALGAYYFHKSSHTNLKLGNGHKVPAGYGLNKASVYGKRFYKDKSVEGDLSFTSYKNRFYGYNTTNFADSIPQIDSKEIRQWYSQVKAKADIYSTVSDSNTFKYKLSIMADYFGDDYDNSQIHIDIPGQISFMINNFNLDLHANYNFLHSILDTINGKNDYAFQFRPILSKKGNQWKVFVGINTFVTSTEKVCLFPEAQINFVVLTKVMEAYFGTTGNLELNHFSKIANENPFIRPGLYINNTKHKLIGYGGIKGQFSSNSGYKIDLRFESIQDQYFFVNDTLSLLENSFIPVYDDLELMKLGGEFWYNPYNYLEFYSKFSYNNYSLVKEEKPWHMPATEFSFTTRYNYKNKIYASLDIIHIGKRYAKNNKDISNPIELNAIWDVNLGLEYNYSDVLSAFLNVHNLLSQQYYTWNQYPDQKLNLLIGLSYRF